MRCRLALLYLVLWIVIGLTGCFQFRSSDKNQSKDLGHLSKDLTIEIDSKVGLNRAIHYKLVRGREIKLLAVFIHGCPGSSSNFFTLCKRFSIAQGL
ncbi:hypothetical protein OAD66_02470 [Bacteroidia bacterium]|nr:hypothetical protein [Bacteroidia bacterium]